MNALTDLRIDAPTDAPTDAPHDAPAGAGGAAAAHTPLDEHGSMGEDGARDLMPALVRGWRGRCPNCGGGPMTSGYLKVRPSCPSCGEELYHHRADDAPAWVTIIIVGHVLVALLLVVEDHFAPPLWVHWAVWPAVTLGLTMWLLPRVKGAIVAMQWAWRMHGFDERAPRGAEDPGSGRD